MRGVPIEERLMAMSVVMPSGCREWTGCLTTTGYAKINYQGEAREAYRVAYEVFVGPVPDGHHLDHLCRNRKCIEVAHLEPVLPRENFRRGNGWAGRHAQQTHCKNGHLFDEKNTYKANGGIHRKCRICVYAAVARYQERKKIAALV